MLTMVEYVHQRIQTYPQQLIGVDMTMEMCIRDRCYNRVAKIKTH